ncbi:MAG: hypothetical protein PVG65_03980 [Candidatus Thorarchaeota archaeon]
MRTTNSFEKLITASLIVLLFSTVPINHPSNVKNSVISFDVRPNPIPSEVVWSENFDDENIDDWEIFGINFTTDPGYLIPGNFSVTGGVLRSVGPEWNFAAYNSSISYGTWSFDIDIQRPEEINRFGVAFMGEKFGEHVLPASGSSDAYLISFRIPDEGPSGDIRIARNTVSGGTDFLDDYDVDNIRGWKNIIVTREESGQFYVYLNGNLILDAVDTTHTTSERFTFFGMANPAIDNITISNTIDYDKAPPKWSHSLADKEIALGEPFYYDINATDQAGIDQYWIDDTQNFAIDDQGVISNISELVIGTYDVTVWVNDTLSNTQTGTFTLTVNADTTEPAPTLIPPELLIAGIAGPIIVIVMFVIWKSRK